MEINYEYNDEYYSKSDNDDGRPYKTVYTNEDEARAKLKELTLNWLKYDCINDRFYEESAAYHSLLTDLQTEGVITKAQVTKSIDRFENGCETGYKEPHEFITSLLPKLTEAQSDTLLNELEKYDIIGYSLVTLELA
jgi:hypothetical protein